jgi:ribosomal protein S18 acetylase RimI-like enzyme
LKAIINDIEYTIEFKQATGQDMIDKVASLFLEYSQSLNVDLSFQNFEDELNSLPGKYSPPDGNLILAFVNDKPVGCIALRRISEDTCEMKRLFVRDAYKGIGIGRSLITMIMDEASRLRYRYIRLDTLPTMKKAQDLYRSFGFYEIEPYVYNPIEGTIFMEFKLKD